MDYIYNILVGNCPLINLLYILFHLFLKKNYYLFINPTWCLLVMSQNITVWQACLLNGFLCHDRSAIYWSLVKPKIYRHDVRLSSKARDTNKHECIIIFLLLLLLSLWCSDHTSCTTQPIIIIIFSFYHCFYYYLLLLLSLFLLFFIWPLWIKDLGNSTLCQLPYVFLIITSIYYLLNAPQGSTYYR